MSRDLTDPSVWGEPMDVVLLNDHFVKLPSK